MIRKRRRFRWKRPPSDPDDVGSARGSGRRHFAGIFTERDVLLRLSLGEHDPRKISVREVMTTPVEMATRATTAAEALATMVERHYRHLPVVDDDGRLLGMLSIRNVLQAQIDTRARQLDQARSVVL